MNKAYNQVITASDQERNALFAETAARLGTAVQNVENVAANIVLDQSGLH